MPNTREQLIDLIGSVEYGNGSLIGKNFQKGFIEKIADHLIANGVTVQKWIPVTERLPEKGGSYLVFSSKSKTVFTAHYWKGDRWANRANGQFITHWMPLPEPPKGETE